jgi:hypothetical protein
MPDGPPSRAVTCTPFWSLKLQQQHQQQQQQHQQQHQQRQQQRSGMPASFNAQKT